jgi:hypothetical protein
MCARACCSASSRNEELDMLLAQAPVYNQASYQVHALAEMTAATPLGAAQDT